MYCYLTEKLIVITNCILVLSHTLCDRFGEIEIYLYHHFILISMFKIIKYIKSEGEVYLMFIEDAGTNIITGIKPSTFKTNQIDV